MASLGEKRLFLLDMDGTIYLDDRLFSGTLPFLNAVRQAGGRYMFLTNNSSKSVEDYVAKLHRLGVPAEKEDFLTSVDALIHDLRSGPHRERIYALGTRSFREQLLGAGLPVTDTVEDGVDTLVIGFDRELTFQKLEDACILLNRGVDFIATNPDWVCPTAFGSVPDCGSMCEMLWHATGRKPRVIGKPQRAMVDLAVHRSGFPKRETVVVGDRLYTDVASGVHGEVDTVFVLSGEGTIEDVPASPEKPTWIYSDIAALHRAWAAAQQREENGI